MGGPIGVKTTPDKICDRDIHPALQAAPPCPDEVEGKGSYRKPGLPRSRGADSSQAPGDGRTGRDDSYPEPDGASSPAVMDR